MEYILHLLILIVFYTLLAQSLNLSAGMTGLVSLAHAGFYGIGAYTTAILSKQFQLPFWINLPVAISVCLTISLIVSLIALRTVDDYFIICTLGIQIIVFSVMNNWMNLTNGPLGINNIPSISLFGIVIDDKISFLLLSVAFMMVVWYALNNLFNSAFGKTLQAIKEDEIYAESIGKDVYMSKVISYVISAVIAVIPGALYAHYTTHVDPKSFTVSESIFILSIVIIGGLGNLRGSFIAATFIILLPEVLRFIGLPTDIAANLRQIIYGAVLILIMLKGRNGFGEVLEAYKR